MEDEGRITSDRAVSFGKPGPREGEKLRETSFTFVDADGEKIFVYRWAPADQQPKAVVQIAHGLLEAAARYRRVAAALTTSGYLVYANDHRGHGKTARSLEELGDWGRMALTLRCATCIFSRGSLGGKIRVCRCFSLATVWGRFWSKTT